MKLVLATVIALICIIVFGAEFNVGEIAEVETPDCIPVNDFTPIDYKRCWFVLNGLDCRGKYAN